MEERKIDPVEKPRPWRALGDPKMDPDFLFLETPDSQCPVNKNARKLSKDEANEYINHESRTSIGRMKGVLSLLRHEEPSSLVRPSLLQAPEREREALMHIEHRRTSSFSLSSSPGQPWRCETQLGTARMQNGNW